jgi:hypothetical protein
MRSPSYNSDAATIPELLSNCKPQLSIAIQMPDIRYRLGAEVRLQGQWPQYTCEPDLPGASIDFALRTAASQFSANAAKVRFQYLPEAG